MSVCSLGGRGTPVSGPRSLLQTLFPSPFREPSPVTGEDSGVPTDRTGGSHPQIERGSSTPSPGRRASDVTSRAVLPLWSRRRLSCFWIDYWNDFTGNPHDLWIRKTKTFFVGLTFVHFISVHEDKRFNKAKSMYTKDTFQCFLYKI